MTVGYASGFGILSLALFFVRRVTGFPDYGQPQLGERHRRI